MKNSNFRSLRIVATSITLFCVCPFATVYADGTEILGTPSVAIASGSRYITAGVGLDAAQPGNLTFDVPAGATIEQVLLYWDGADANPIGGPPVIGTTKDLINVDGAPVEGVFIGGRTAGGGTQFYEKVYCARGKMENMIKEHKLYTRSRTARRATAGKPTSQFRLFLHSGAYWLLHQLRQAAPRRNRCGARRRSKPSAAPSSRSPCVSRSSSPASRSPCLRPIHIAKTYDLNGRLHRRPRPLIQAARAAAMNAEHQPPTSPKILPRKTAVNPATTARRAQIISPP